MKMHLAARFKSLRTKHLGLSRKVLADKSDVSPGTIQRFEQLGEISLGNLLALAKALNAEEPFLSLFESREIESIDDLAAQATGSQRRHAKKS